MSNKKWLINGEKTVGPNAQISFPIKWPSATTVTITTADNTDVRIYRRGDDLFTDLAGTLMPDGAHAYSGNRITLRPFKNGVPGETYIVALTPTVDGVVDEFFFEVRVMTVDGG